MSSTINPEAPQPKAENLYIRHMAEVVKSNITNSDSLLMLLNQGITVPEAIRTTSQAVAAGEISDLSEADMAFVGVFGEIGVFAQADFELKLLQKKQADKEALTDTESKRAKELKLNYIIPFNHRLKEYINEHPDQSYKQVASALSNIYSLIFYRYNCLNNTSKINPLEDPSAEQVHRSILSALNGMRHELAAETLLTAAGYDYEYSVSTEDDAKGTDIYVLIDGVKYKIDIKASLTGVEKSEENARKYNKSSNAVWTGLHDYDFTGPTRQGRDTLSISHATARQYAPEFIKRITEMIERNKLEASARSVGRAVLKSA